MTARPPPMSRDTVLRVVRALRERGVLIGGQAIAWWVEHYRAQGRLEHLTTLTSVYTSRDLDVLVEAEHLLLVASTIAADLNGTVRRPPRSQWNTLLGAQVEFIDGAGRFEVDVLKRLNGVAAKDVQATAVRFEGRDELPSLLVIHPVLLLEQRLRLIVDFAEYQTDHALAQARLTVAVVQERLLDELAVGWPAARRSVRRALEVATGKVAEKIRDRHGVEALDAVPHEHPNYPAAFLTEQRRRMVGRRR